VAAGGQLHPGQHIDRGQVRLAGPGQRPLFHFLAVGSDDRDSAPDLGLGHTEMDETGALNSSDR
jgi:hypothetical protein